SAALPVAARDASGRADGGSVQCASGDLALRGRPGLRARLLPAYLRPGSVLPGQPHVRARRHPRPGAAAVPAHGTTDPPTPVPGGCIPPHGASGAAHPCFAIPLGELAAWEAHLARHGLEVESRVSRQRGGQSRYFRDPDGHSLEVATPRPWPNF